MSESPGRSRWGLFVYGLYGAFAVFILALVLYASVQDFSLVEDKYYEQTLVYQEHIDRENRSLSLPVDLEIRHDLSEERMIFSFPIDSVSSKQIPSGTITLYRPSNARYDRSYQISTDSAGVQSISADELVRGLWEIKVDWTLNGNDYYNQSRLVIP
jgi:hypothetical protein